jgi:hypothetical protein
MLNSETMYSRQRKRFAASYRAPSIALLLLLRR